MLNVECNGGFWPAGIKARDGTLWFPTQDGVAVIDPGLGVDEPAAAACASSNRSCSTASRSARCRSIARCASRRAGARSRSGTRASASSTRSTSDSSTGWTGSIDDWVDAGTRRTAYYSHVPPGRYTFTVIAANSDGVWNTDGPSLRIVVLPPFYRTWWFLTLALRSARRRCVVAHVEAAGIAAAARARRAAGVLAPADRLAGSRAQAHRGGAARQPRPAAGRSSRTWRAARERRRAPTRIARRVDEISAEAAQAIGEVREIAQNLRPHQLDRLGLTKALAGHASGKAAGRVDDRVDGRRSSRSTVSFRRRRRSTSTASSRKA